LHGAEKNTVNNAVKYADYAVGEFIRKARGSDYWHDTVFLIVADHNSRVYGAELIPLEHFHIPGLILGGSIEPAIYSAVASQIDLAPTLLSLIGVSSEHPMIGHDLMGAGAAAIAGRAIMQYNGTQAYLQGDSVVVLQKNLPIVQYAVANDRLLAVEESDPKLIRRALAHATWTSVTYEESMYRLPTEGALTAGAP
jgi:phosphoglycerol transferase MdoB-like AlkP superfamily enzyme